MIKPAFDRYYRYSELTDITAGTTVTVTARHDRTGKTSATLTLGG